MSNGAAGCGYEYTNPDYRCPFLSRVGEGFECLKYHQPLRTAERTGHPFRCSECKEDADKHVTSILAKQKLLRRRPS